jgi:hypothetical protein
MRILTDIGEIGIHATGRDVLLRPSLYAMSQLADAVDSFATLHGVGSPRDQFHAALDVLQACTDEDITDLVGRMGSRYGTWVMGQIPPADLILLALSLIRHGVVGVVPKLPPSPEEGGYTSVFEPRELVASAIAHLGLNEDQAWQLTVTGYVLAMRAKFPRPKNGPGAPSAAELDAAFERLSAINKAR